MRDIKF